MIITRHHEVGQVPVVVEIDPTSLPELFKQPWSTSNSQEVEQCEIPNTTHTCVYLIVYVRSGFWALRIGKSGLTKINKSETSLGFTMLLGS